MFALEIQGKKTGKTLLVTGGMDGDEYAGIEAAYSLAERYKGGNFAGRLIIVPIVNTPGFRSESSQNPKDGKFPKFIFPGSWFGSSSESIVLTRISSHVARADAWLDLHGGALTERVNPFLWLFKTGVETIDDTSERFCKSSGAEHVVFEQAERTSKARRLAEQGCLYIMTESGERGFSITEDVNRHLGWAEALMRTLEMLPAAETHTFEQKIFNQVSYVYAPHDGILRTKQLGLEIMQGDTLGTCTYMDGSSETTITSPQSGMVLWYKETISMRRGDVLYAIGY